DESLGELDHQIAERRDLLAVEGRLHELPLGTPELALAGQQSLTERELRLTQTVVLDEPAVLVDEYFLDEVGVVGEQDALRPESGRHEVTILARPPRQRAEAIGAELLQVAGDPPARRAGRTARKRGIPAHRRAARGHLEPPIKYDLGISAPATGRRFRIRH